MECCFHQLQQKVLDLPLAIPQAEKALLQSAEARDVIRDVETQDLAVAVQEFHHRQTVGEGWARENQSRNPRQLWKGLEITKVKKVILWHVETTENSL